MAFESKSLNLGLVLVSSLILGAASTVGDVLWAEFQVRHTMVNGLVHGTLLLLLLGLVLGWGGDLRRLMRGAVGGPAVGLAGALVFYATAPLIGYRALFVAWMALWIMTSLLYQLIRKAPLRTGWAARGCAAALVSGGAFYSISGIWLSPAVAAPTPLYNFLCWTFAFGAGLAPLLIGRDQTPRTTASC